VALSIAYTRLFLGPPEMLAPPYASFYLDRGRGVMGPSTVEIMKLYGAAGLVLDNDFDQTPDHVSVMLEFLYYLAFREDIAAARNDLEEKARFEEKKLYFLNTYVTTWIPRFCAKITSADEHPFYTGLGKCLDAFVRYRCDLPTRTEHGI
jgi:putative dimethyl sulfoxide reductase chaperone